MRSFSDAQTLPDRTEEQCIMVATNIYHTGEICLEHIKAKQGPVVVRGEGDLWGRGGYRHLCSSLSRTTPITERHALRLEV